MIPVDPTNDVLPFFEKHVDEFLDFYHKNSGSGSLCKIMVAFVEHKGLPFNMQTYMRKQSEYIKTELANLDFEHGDECERQLLVAQWIHKEAHSFRKKVIEDQKEAIQEWEELLVKNLPECIQSGL